MPGIEIHFVTCDAVIPVPQGTLKKFKEAKVEGKMAQVVARADHSSGGADHSRGGAHVEDMYVPPAYLALFLPLMLHATFELTTRELTMVVVDSASCLLTEDAALKKVLRAADWWGLVIFSSSHAMVTSFEEEHAPWVEAFTNNLMYILGLGHLQTIETSSGKGVSGRRLCNYLLGASRTGAMKNVFLPDYGAILKSRDNRELNWLRNYLRRMESAEWEPEPEHKAGFMSGLFSSITIQAPRKLSYSDESEERYIDVQPSQQGIGAFGPGGYQQGDPELESILEDELSSGKNSTLLRKMRRVHDNVRAMGLQEEKYHILINKSGMLRRQLSMALLFKLGIRCAFSAVTAQCHTGVSFSRDRHRMHSSLPVAETIDFCNCGTARGMSPRVVSYLAMEMTTVL